MINNIITGIKVPWYVFKSGMQILSSPRLLSLCLVPVIIGSVTSLVVLVLGFVYRETFTTWIGFSPDSWYFVIIPWLVFLLSTIASAIAGFTVASIVGGFFIEQIVEIFLERANMRKEDNEQGIIPIIKSTFRALVNESFLLIILLICSIFIFVLSFLPVLALVPITISAFISGANLYMLPLALLELPLSQRLRIIKNSWFPCLCLGFCFTLSLLIPFAAVLLMPAFYSAVIEVLKNLPAEHSPAKRSPVGPTTEIA